VLAPPYYFPAGQSELLEYLKHLTPELPLPLLLYNMPSYTKLVFEPKTVRAAAGINGIVGIKESSGDMTYFGRLLSQIKKQSDFSLLMGHEELLAEAVLAGAHGGVCGGANLDPRLYVDLYKAACSKDLPAVESLQKKVMEISTAIYGVGKYESSYLKGLKCALSCMDICSDFLAEPFHRFRRAERNVIRRHVKELGLM
jgi:4-hydroxy-tetrahydrodipicolinate synthase